MTREELLQQSDVLDVTPTNFPPGSIIVGRQGLIRVERWGDNDISKVIMVSMWNGFDTNRLSQPPDNPPPGEVRAEPVEDGKQLPRLRMEQAPEVAAPEPEPQVLTSTGMTEMEALGRFLLHGAHGELHAQWRSVSETQLPSTKPSLLIMAAAQSMFKAGHYVDQHLFRVLLAACGSLPPGQVSRLGIADAVGRSLEE